VLLIFFLINQNRIY